MTIDATTQEPAEGTSAQRIAGPPSERLAARIAARQATPPSVLDDLTRLDLAIYRAIAETPTPTLDEPLRRLSNAADHSKLWLMVAGLIGALGGISGRRTALTALVPMPGSARAVPSVPAVARTGTPPTPFVTPVLGQIVGGPDTGLAADQTKRGVAAYKAALERPGLSRRQLLGAGILA